MSKTTSKFSPEVRECAVRMVFDGEGPHASAARAKLVIAVLLLGPRAWSSRFLDELVAQGFLPFQRKDRTSKPRDQTPNENQPPANPARFTTV